MKITDVEFYLVEIPRGDEYAPVRSLIVRLSSDQGFEGWGETTSDWRPTELEGRRSALLPALVGHTIFNIAELAVSDALATPELRTAVEMAQWDLLGRALKQPLNHLWGGMYRQRIPLVVRLPSLQQPALAAFARELADCGFHAQILPATGDLEMDSAAVASVREALGPRAELRFDGLHSYAIDDARRLSLALAHENVSLWIDPLKPHEREHLTRLAHQSAVPLAAASAIQSAADVLAIAREDGMRAVIFAPESMGGISAVRSAATVADAAGLIAALGGRATLGLGTAARLQLASTVPCLAIGNECAAHGLRDDILATPLSPSDGMLTVPAEPGLGVTVDRGRLERWQVD